MQQQPKVQIILDSVNSITGQRITTFQIEIWKILLQELNTHRMFSRSAASSRAVPTKKMRRMAWHNPYIPNHWGKNGKGMQAKEELTGWRKALAIFIWKLGGKLMCILHWLLELLKLHKQVANRMLEPWLRAQVVITSTTYDNYFNLRAHEAAQPDFQAIAYEMQRQYENSIPTVLVPGLWHIPYILPEEDHLSVVEKVRISAARCARTSYYYHDGNVSRYEDDLDLCMRLMGTDPVHASPFEHQALAVADRKKTSGNFRNGWVQHRELVESKAVNFSLK